MNASLCLVCSRSLLAVLLVAPALACSADPRREHVWSEYERELVRLEADGRDDERLALVRRGLVDPETSADERCRFQLEATRSLARLGREPEARAEIAEARSTDGGPACAERADLLALRLWPSVVDARTFLVNHPRSSVYAAVLGDLLHTLEPAAALEQIDDLLRRTDDPAARCVLTLEQARRVQLREPPLALGLFDQVADAGCARSPDAAVEAVSLLATLGRFADVRARFEATRDEAVAWTACRSLDHEPPDAASTSCLQAFAERFPGSRKVDDAWFLLAERAEAAGDVPAATTLYRRIVDERPDGGRAARAGRRLDELRSPARP